MLAPLALSLVLAPAPAEPSAPVVQRPTVQRPGAPKPAPPPAATPPTAPESPAPSPPPEAVAPSPAPVLPSEPEPPPSEDAAPVLPPSAPLDAGPTPAPDAATPPALPTEPAPPSSTSWDAAPVSSAPVAPASTPEPSPFDDPDGPAVALPGAAELEKEVAEANASAGGPALRGDANALADFRRKGTAIRVGGGLMHCPQEGCDIMRMGGNGHLEIGYRPGLVFASAFLDGGGGPLASDFVDEAGDDISGGSFTFLGLGAQVLIFPVKEGRIDPYIGGGLGWQRVSTAVELDDESFWGSSGVPERVTFKRPSARVSAGLDVYLTRRLTLGPRFDWWLPFAGTQCILESSGQEECEDIRREVGDGDSAFSNRSTRRNTPKARAFTVDFTAYF